MVAHEPEDKPDYAADWFRPAPKPVKPKADADAQLHVADFLDSDAAAKLAKLKAEMESAEKPSPAKKGTSAKRVAPLRRADGDDAELSFAELLNPSDEDEEDFSKLLEESRLDWRAFKK